MAREEYNNMFGYVISRDGSVDVFTAIERLVDGVKTDGGLYLLKEQKTAKLDNFIFELNPPEFGFSAGLLGKFLFSGQFKNVFLGVNTRNGVDSLVLMDTVPMSEYSEALRLIVSGKNYINPQKIVEKSRFNFTKLD